MIFDYYASLHKNEVGGKASSFLTAMTELENQLKRTRDRNQKREIKKTINEKKKELGDFLNDAPVEKTTIWVFGEKDKRVEDVKEQFRIKSRKLKNLKLPSDLKLEPNFSQLPDPAWIGIEVEFELLTPWYSKDDRPFHVLDNPVRKDRVFGVPFMSAASWKGLLRWAFKMHTGLIDLGDKKLSDKDNKHFKMQEVFLFGNERGEGEEFSRGALIFYPTWFDKVGFEVINPHSRKTRAGINPIYYEVVPPPTKGMLRLLYAPPPGRIERDRANPAEVTAHLIDAITVLFEKYGISAKRTSGWGAVEVKAVNDKSKAITLYVRKGSWLDQNIDTNNHKEFVPPEEKFKRLMDEKGQQIKALFDDNGKILSKTQFKKLGDKKPDCTNADFEIFKEWYEKHGEEHKRLLKGAGDREGSSRTVKRTFDSLAGFKTILENARKGGAK